MYVPRYVYGKIWHMGMLSQNPNDLDLNYHLKIITSEETPDVCLHI